MTPEQEIEVRNLIRWNVVNAKWIKLAMDALDAERETVRRLEAQVKRMREAMIEAIEQARKQEAAFIAPILENALLDSPDA